MAAIGSIHDSGDQPGPGLYVCIKCPDRAKAESVRLTADDQPLPDCSTCGHSRWRCVGGRGLVEWPEGRE